MKKSVEPVKPLVSNRCPGVTREDTLSRERIPSGSSVGSCRSTKAHIHSTSCPASPHNQTDSIRTRWAGYKKVNRTPASKAVTKIPRAPTAPTGKENKSSRPLVTTPQGKSARVVKPVVRQTRLLKDPASEKAQEVPRTPGVTPVTSPIPPLLNSKSPNFISSKKVPDLHNKFLAKIRSYKVKSRTNTPLQSPYKAPPPVTPDLIVNQEEDLEYNLPYRDTESPIEDNELDQYLTFMFSACDQYKTGRVTAASLLDYLSNLVDLPKLDKWKLEELNRLLDPSRDNRYVDLDMWMGVGKSWVEMMIDPDNHVSSGGEEKEESEVKLGEAAEGVADISFGSLEGVGGPVGCSSKEVELENKVSELSYQLGKIGEENIELQRALTVSEDISANLTIELELSRRKLTNMTNVREREVVSRDLGEIVEQVVEVDTKEEEQGNCLAAKVEHLLRENSVKNEKLKEMEQECASCRGEAEENRKKEEEVRQELRNLKEANEALKKEINLKEEELVKEKQTRDKLEVEVEEKTGQITGLEEEMAIKEEELKSQVANLKEGQSRVREGSVGSSASSNLSNSMVHDMSVDDRIIEEFHTSRPTALLTPIRRGPSASSTPHKGSIGEELKDLDSYGGDFLSPLCEKIEKLCPKVELMRSQERLAECLRKLLCEEVDPAKTGRLMAALNKALALNRKETEVQLEDLKTVKDYNSVKGDLEEIKKSLTESVEKKAATEEETEPPNELVEAEVKLSEMTSLLQTANEALLATSEVTPEGSLESGEPDFSSWQLDLDGIQLMGCHGHQLLGRRLMQLKRPTTLADSVATSSQDVSLVRKMNSSPMIKIDGPDMACVTINLGRSRLWQSLYKKLEDLHVQTEISRDLLHLAGDSLLQSRLGDSTGNMLGDSRNYFPKTVSCQTQEVESELVCQASQTDVQPLVVSQEKCLVVDCFCSNGEERQQRRFWRLMLRLLMLMVTILLLFTFCCGLEVDHSPYYPVTWYMVRRIVGERLPKPLTALSYNTMPGHRLF